MPNTLYDPKKGAEEYESYINQLVYAEKLGFDVIAVNEHHQTAYGIMPAPNLIAANLIARTTKAKIAIIGRALPLVNNPVNIAEEFAMLDNCRRAASSPASSAASATSITRPASTRIGRTSATRRRTT